MLMHFSHEKKIFSSEISHFFAFRLLAKNAANFALFAKISLKSVAQKRENFRETNAKISRNRKMSGGKMRKFGEKLLIMI